MTNTVSNIFTNEDLVWAWKKLVNDIQQNRVFANYYYEKDIYSKDMGTWLNSNLVELNDGSYRPSPVVICNIPKPGFGIRPGGYLCFKDRLVYYSLLGKLLPFIKKELEWSDGKVDFGNNLEKKVGSIETIKNRYKSWSRFRKNGIKLLGEGYEQVVFADITGYYENIDIFTLCSDLRQVGVPNEYTILLSTCLKRWGPGLPQGFTPSDILSKFFMNVVDQEMAENYIYTRYSDDFRIFCKTTTEAKKAIQDLIILLRGRFLNLQTAKTHISNADDAKIKIDGVNPLIEKTIQDFSNEILTHVSYEDPYVTGYEDQIIEIANNPYSTVEDYEFLGDKIGVIDSIKVFKKAFDDYFFKKDIKFEHTLFRFLLSVLGKQGDDYAVDYCLALLITNPEETNFIIKYFEKVGINEKMVIQLINFLDSEDAIYEYQIYQILTMYSKICQKDVNIDFLRISRQFAYDMSCPFYLRSVAKKIIGEIGNQSDLEKLMSIYGSTSGIEQSEILMALKRVEKGRRNLFYKNALSDNPLNPKAISILQVGV